jgi:hypothetical protein
MRVYLSVDERVVEVARRMLAAGRAVGVVGNGSVHEFATDAILGRLAWLDYRLVLAGAMTDHGLAGLLEELGGSGGVGEVADLSQLGGE